MSVRVCVCVYMHANMHTIPQRRAPPDGLSLNSAWKSLIRLDLGVHIFNVPGFAFGVRRPDRRLHLISTPGGVV